MKLVNSTLNQSNQFDALALIQAIESDFTNTDKVLIKAEWVMQNTVTKLQKQQLTTEERKRLIEELSSTIISVRSQLNLDKELIDTSEKIVA